MESNFGVYSWYSSYDCTQLANWCHKPLNLFMYLKIYFQTKQVDMRSKYFFKSKFLVVMKMLEYITFHVFFEYMTLVISHGCQYNIHSCTSYVFSGFSSDVHFKCGRFVKKYYIFLSLLAIQYKTTLIPPEWQELAIENQLFYRFTSGCSWLESHDTRGFFLFCTPAFISWVGNHIPQHIWMVFVWVLVRYKMYTTSFASNHGYAYDGP